jgi:DNA transformation protein and related proteins
MGQLSKLPNIGKELENNLLQAGINTPDELKNVGSCKAFQLIHAIDSTACISKLCALEGAIQGIRWHKLDDATKQKLKDYLNLLQLSAK